MRTNRTMDGILCVTVAAIGLATYETIRWILR